MIILLISLYVIIHSLLVGGCGMVGAVNTSQYGYELAKLSNSQQEKAILQTQEVQQEANQQIQQQQIQQQQQQIQQQQIAAITGLGMQLDMRG